MHHKLIEIMQNHIGKSNAISGNDLAELLGTNTRQLRHVTDTVIDHGIALCSHAAYGYWIAANVDELEEACKFHDNRAMHELAKSAKLRNLNTQDLLGQMRLNT